MPISKYNSVFGGNANKAFKAMQSRYGSEGGKRVFYATINKKKKNYKHDVIRSRANGS